MTLANLLSGAVGGIIGAVLGAFIGWWVTRSQWELDCERQEWRELIDAAGCAAAASTEFAMSPNQQQWDALDVAVSALVRVTTDRLFIPEKTADAIAVAAAKVILEMRQAGQNGATNPGFALKFQKLKQAARREAMSRISSFRVPRLRWPPRSAGASSRAKQAGAE